MFRLRKMLWVASRAVLWVAVSAQAATPALAEVEVNVGHLEALVGAARFREAAEEAPILRGRVLELSPGTETRRLLVRTEIAAASAALALRQDGNARVYLHRALQLEPALRLGASAAPKLRRALDALREPS